MIIVAPLAGVWIEMLTKKNLDMTLKSLPLRECGLKYAFCMKYKLLLLVAPLAGVWIEISC